MNEYSFLQGVIEGGNELYNYCKNKGFEQIYTKLNFVEQLIADSCMKNGLKELLKSMTNNLNPGSKVNELLHSRGFNGNILDCFKDKNCIQLISEASGIVDKLQKTYDSEALNHEKYSDGVKLLINVLDSMYSQIPLSLKALVNLELSRKIRELEKSGKDVSNIDKSIDETMSGCIYLLTCKIN